MGPKEIAARLRERGRKNKEIVVPFWEPPGRQDCAEWMDSRFLFGPAGARRIIQSWRRFRPEQTERLVDFARRGLDAWEISGVPVALEPGRLDWHRGDTRWVWELNRHQFLFTFARAFLLTGEAVFLDRITALLEDWREKNPFGRGRNWSSALEVGLRSISWLWTLAAALPDLEERLLRAWLRSLQEHYEYLASHLSIYSDPTNHLIGEAAALWILSVAVPTLPEARRREQRALKILTREIERQVTPDGVDREQSTGYQRFVLDFYLQVLAVARRAGRNLPPIIGERVAAMLEFLAALSGEGGEPPSVGDADGARGVPFGERPDLADVAVWLDEPALAHSSRSRVFPRGGYCLWQAGDAALLFDVGPIGLWPNASHGHADALSVQARIRGRWLLADPGTGAYGASIRVRDSLRGTAAHNTVTVDGLDQTDALDLFKWLRPVPTRLLDADMSEEFDYAMAVHEGYHRLRQPVTHYRAVLFVRPPASTSGWVIADRLDGEGRHHCALRFHFPPGTEVRGDGTGAVVALDPEEGAGLRFSFSDADWRLTTGLWSSRFGDWEPAPVLLIERTAELPLAWFTFLSPGAGSEGLGSVTTERRGSTVLAQRGEETVEWAIEGSRHRFLYRRTGAQPAGFER